MSRPAFPFAAGDISAVARSLKDQIAQGGHTPPGHVELLNMLARAAGYRNFQHFRAQAVAQGALDAPAEPTAPEEPVDFVKVRRLTRYFDPAGRLLRWPSKASHQQACLWVLWARLPGGTVMDEPGINRHLTAGHLFGDYALLRRWMCDLGMVKRTTDGREYRRVEQRPPAEVLALIRHLGNRHIGNRPTTSVSAAGTATG